MNRSARCAVVRAVLVVLLTLIALWGTQAGAGAAAVPLQGSDTRTPGSSSPADPVDPAGEGQQDTAETEQPVPPCRAERRGAQARDRQAPVVMPRPDPRGAAAPVTPPPAPLPTRSVVLRC
ncbi:hypothetical protein ACWCXB_06115 [Streptomyces sp. NPDC001514]